MVLAISDWAVREATWRVCFGLGIVLPVAVLFFPPAAGQLDAVHKIRNAAEHSVFAGHEEKLEANDWYLDGVVRV